MKSLLEDRPVLFVVILGMISGLIYVSPWIVFGEDSYVRIHDSLDSLVAWHTIIAREGIWFAPNNASVVPVFVGGAPRISLPSELSLTTGLFAVLTPYWAYILQQFIIRLIAFTGMALFVLDIIPSSHRFRFCLALVGGLTLAIIPFWAWTGASAGIGWVSFAIVRLIRGQAPWSSYAVLAIYPLITSIVLTGMFIIGILWCLAAWATWRGVGARPLFVAALIATIAHIAVEYRLFLYLLDPGFISHRVEFAVGTNELGAALKAFFADLLGTDSSVPSLQSPVILKIVIIVAALALTGLILRQIAPRFPLSSWLHPNADQRCLLKIFTCSFIAIIVLSFFFAFWEWSGSQFIREKIPLFKLVNLSRGAFFQPFLWSLVFVIALSLVTERMGRVLGYFVIGAAMLAQLANAAVSHEYFAERRQNGVTYSKFVSKELFNEIVQKLGLQRSAITVATVGIHPSILQINGFRTADAYLGLYPLEYKHRFRELMYPEFSRNKDVLSYFDGFGSRVYVFSSEISCPRNGAVCTSDDGYRIKRFAVPARDFQRFGIDYLFSNALIENSSELGMVNLGTFRNPKSAWAITVYRMTDH